MGQSQGAAGPEHIAPLNIVIVSDFGTANGGASHVANQVAAGLARRGFPTTLVYAVGPIDPVLVDAGVTPRQVEASSVWKMRNPMCAAIQGVWNGAAAKGLAEVLEGLDPAATIVHFHQWTKAFSPSVLVKAIALGFPVAITLHDYFIGCPNGAYYHFKAQRPCRERPLSAACLMSCCDSRSAGHKLVRVLRKLVQDAALARLPAPAFIHVSRFARGIAEPMLPAGALHQVIPNPIEAAPSDRVRAEENAAFLFAGRLTPEKGCVQFARAARAAGVEAVFVGSGPCEAAIREANPAARLLGWLERDEVAAILCRARAMVFPSLWYETAGLSGLEALAAGVPLLASRITGVADYIEDGVEGALFDPGDQTGLATLLRRLDGDAGLVAAMSHAAHAHHNRRHGVDSHIDRLIAFYQDLLTPAASLAAGIAPAAKAP